MGYGAAAASSTMIRVHPHLADLGFRRDVSRAGRDADPVSKVALKTEKCVTGIATQDPEHESRYDPEAESHNIHRFLEGVRWQIAALTHALGYSDFRALNRDDLVALTPEAAEITGLPHEPGTRAKTPELRVQLG